MQKSIKVEVENLELAIKNSYGDIVIVPSNKANWVKQKIKEGCYGCIDGLVDSLPSMREYAQDGSVIPADRKVSLYIGKDINYDVKTMSPRLGERKNEDGTYSTHKMAYSSSDGKYQVYPTLFQNDKKEWVELSDDDNWAAYAEAKKRKEIYEFDDENKAKEFAAGSWKTQYKEYDISSPEYKKLYDSGHLMSYDKNTDTYISTPLKEVSVVAKKQYDYQGCVSGLCNSLSEKNKMSTEEYRKVNNLYGDAWKIADNAYKVPIDISKDYTGLKENDIVNLSRDSFKSDIEKGIPSENQHVGYISKIVDGVPYVKHYISNVGMKSDGKTPYGEYFEEPINDIKEKYKYKASGAFRPDSNKEVNLGQNNFKYDDGYKPNEVESSYANLHNQKQDIQQKLKLDDGEYDDIARMSYGIMGVESNFGRSSRTAYRMTVPDFVQKGVKMADDLRRSVNVYDENINNLSQGYSSTKESGLHGVSKNDLNDTSNSNAKIREGDYTGLERTNNYLYIAFKNLGINPDNLDSGANSGKAIMATLAWFKKRKPNATEDDLLKMYTGKRNITEYKKEYDKNLQNINQIKSDNIEHTLKEDLYGFLSNIANKNNSILQDVKSNIVSAIRDYSPLPENANALASDLLGGKKDITEKSLSSSTYNALQQIVKSNVSKGKFTLEYNDYGTSKGKNDDVGGKENTSITKMATDEKYILKTMLGQAAIVKINNNEYEIQDRYDFNDAGKSFGVIDDLKKRGYSPYAIMRALGRNMGSVDGQGSKVKIRIKLK